MFYVQFFDEGWTTDHPNKHVASPLTIIINLIRGFSPHNYWGDLEAGTLLEVFYKTMVMSSTFCICKTCCLFGLPYMLCLTAFHTHTHTLIENVLHILHTARDLF